MIKQTRKRKKVK